VSERRPFRWDAVIIAAGAAIAVAAIGSTLTDLGPWYQSLKQPDWRPPDAAFGFIWTVVFALTALSGVLAWRGAKTASERQAIIGLFAINGFLNVLWSLIFFQLKRPDHALVEVVLLWLSIVALIVATWRASKLASLALVPYLIWVSIAAVLNYEVVRMNGPFG
jgi:translocator protein